MGGRYLISEVQFEMIIGAIISDDHKSALGLLHEVRKRQFIGDSEKDLTRDLQKIRHIM